MTIAALNPVHRWDVCQCCGTFGSHAPAFLDDRDDGSTVVECDHCRSRYLIATAAIESWRVCRDCRCVAEDMEDQQCSDCRNTLA